MSNNEEDQDLTKAIAGGKRPHVRAYAQVSGFTVGDSVYYNGNDGSRDGPFIVATPPVGGKCTLCYSDGRPFQNKAMISLDNLDPN
ncbi:hypothetical protein FVEN_g8813 [Fusarium venenatum]|uniref:Uncharacterized protein n=1 Tax=Fusarium venenatum TaxID=56646 RepID=A0A2L2T457_9HYPO|nr:uncharacterized protein FVRRES_02064 [Fusarium venenatum]KAG8353185.1 hypothetical protein FVEN_g8813 [Fusarium venenatum]KAH7004804.1 hypothetical protein EDB82DRAFT_59820 [Fusarium venenatum]CEI65552.1 unnamed protein product [Fusarium venenatum]